MSELWNTLVKKKFQTIPSLNQLSMLLIFADAKTCANVMSKDPFACFPLCPLGGAIGGCEPVLPGSETAYFPKAVTNLNLATLRTLLSYKFHSLCILFTLSSSYMRPAIKSVLFCIVFELLRQAQHALFSGSHYIINNIKHIYNAQVWVSMPKYCPHCKMSAIQKSMGFIIVC